MYKKSTFLSFFATFILCFLLVASDVFAFIMTDDKTLRVKWDSGFIQPGTCSSSGGHAGWPSGGRTDTGNQDYGPGTVLPGSYTYAFTCFSDPTSVFLGAPITAYANATILPNINIQLAFSDAGSPSPFPPPTPTLTLTSSVSYAYEGDGYTLTWNYNDPYGTCTAGGSWTGTKSAVSTANLYNNNMTTIDRSRTYSLTCTSPSGGGDSKSVTVIQEARGGGCASC